MILYIYISYFFYRPFEKSRGALAKMDCSANIYIYIYIVLYIDIIYISYEIIQ
jgi:hypothetical protein